MHCSVLYVGGEASSNEINVPMSVYIIIYRIAGIFRGGKFSRKPLQLYYSNYSRAEFSRNTPSSAKKYPFCTELTVRAALCNHTLARHLFAD